MPSFSFLIIFLIISIRGICYGRPFAFSVICVRNSLLVWILRIIFRCFALYISYCTSILSILDFRVARKSNLFGIFLVRFRWRVYNRPFIPFFLFLIVILHFEMRAYILLFFPFLLQLKGSSCVSYGRNTILFSFAAPEKWNAFGLISVAKR